MQGTVSGGHSIGSGVTLTMSNIWRPPAEIFGAPTIFLQSSNIFSSPVEALNQTLNLPTYGTFLQPNTFNS